MFLSSLPFESKGLKLAPKCRSLLLWPVNLRESCGRELIRCAGVFNKAHLAQISYRGRLPSMPPPFYTPRWSGVLGRILKDRMVNRHGLGFFQYLEDGEEVNEKTKRQGILSQRDLTLAE